MAHLSPLKGGFPFKDQHDRSELVDPESGAIERGSVICVNEDGYFTLAADADKGPLYLALQDTDDLQAVFAGTFSIGKGVPAADNKGVVHITHKGEAGHAGYTEANKPKISGIHMDDGDVWEFDMYDPAGDYKIGTPLTVKDGRVTPAGDGETVVGYVTKTPYRRYANDATLLKGMITGASIWVIAFQCGK